MPMPRRKFLLALLGTVLVGPFAGSTGAVSASATPDIRMLESVRRVGEAYLAQCPAEAVRSRLLAALEQALEQALAGSGRAQTAERLKALIRADFSAGRTIMLDGWVLSVTECRLCALYVAA